MYRFLAIVLSYSLILCHGCKQRIPASSSAKVVNMDFQSSPWFKNYQDEHPEKASLLNELVEEKINTEVSKDYNLQYFLLDLQSGKRIPVNDITQVNYVKDGHRFFFTYEGTRSVFKSKVVRKGSKVEVWIMEYSQKDLFKAKNKERVVIDSSLGLKEYRESLTDGLRRFKSFISRVDAEAGFGLTAVKSIDVAVIIAAAMFFVVVARATPSVYTVAIIAIVFLVFLIFTISDSVQKGRKGSTSFDPRMDQVIDHSYQLR